MLQDRFAIVRRSIPEQAAAIDGLLAAGDSVHFYADFVEACEDFEACERALAEPTLQDYAQEFRLLRSEIEDEIRRYLQRYARPA